MRVVVITHDLVLGGRAGDCDRASSRVMARIGRRMGIVFDIVGVYVTRSMIPQDIVLTAISGTRRVDG